MTATAEYDLRLFTGEQAHAVRGAVLDAYNEIYDVPPYKGDPFFGPQAAADRLDRAIIMGGYQVITAHDEDDGELIGFIYGVTLQASAPWWTSLTAPSDGEPAGAVTELQGHVHAGEVAWLRELAVREPWRNTRVGRRLHDRFVRQRTDDFGQQCTALTCIIDNEPAHSAYQRWGYQIIGRIKHAPESPVYDAMILAPRP